TLVDISIDSGLIYGVAVNTIFSPSKLQTNWTPEDKLKNLFFESLLWAHWTQSNFLFDKETFITDLASYYSSIKPNNSFDFLSFFKKESAISSIETAIEERLELDKRILETRIWLNTLNNAFLFLDVILFKEFLKKKKIRPFQTLAEKAMHCFVGAVHTSTEVSEIEEKLFILYAASAKLDREIDDDFKIKFQTPLFQLNLEQFKNESEDFNLFLVYLSAFVFSCKSEVNKEERTFLENLCRSFNLNIELSDIALAHTTAFILQNEPLIPYLGSSTEILFSNLSKRWGKILLRNKDKLVLEIQQSKELMFLLAKSTQKDLTKEEKEVVKNQLMDIMRSMPSLAIFLIPGGSLLLPIFLKIIPGLMPSAFRDNEVNKDN
ncbi:MAG: LETM1 domain-containing protein, partial [Bacteroidota bacterium]